MIMGGFSLALSTLSGTFHSTDSGLHRRAGLFTSWGDWTGHRRMSVCHRPTEPFPASNEHVSAKQMILISHSVFVCVSVLLCIFLVLWDVWVCLYVCVCVCVCAYVSVFVCMSVILPSCNGDPQEQEASSCNSSSWMASSFNSKHWFMTSFSNHWHNWLCHRSPTTAIIGYSIGLQPQP